MAHLLEHLLFIKSTHDRDIKKELQDHGARWNGTTWFDRTNYFETVNASDDNLRWALGLEAERMVKDPQADGVLRVQEDEGPCEGSFEGFEGLVPFGELNGFFRDHRGGSR